MVRFGAAADAFLGLFSLTRSPPKSVRSSVPPSIFFVFLPHVKRGRDAKEGGREARTPVEARASEMKPMSADGFSGEI